MYTSIHEQKYLQHFVHCDYFRVYKYTVYSVLHIEIISMNANMYSVCVMHCNYIHIQKYLQWIVYCIFSRWQQYLQLIVNSNYVQKYLQWIAYFIYIHLQNICSMLCIVLCIVYCIVLCIVIVSLYTCIQKYLQGSAYCIMYIHYIHWQKYLQHIVYNKLN